MKKRSVRKTKKVRELEEVVKILNQSFEDGYAAEMIENDFALFPNGEIWICEGCDAIHIGFHLDAHVALVGLFARALDSYSSRLNFETIPAFLSEDGHFYQGEEALRVYGEMLVSIASCDHNPPPQGSLQ